MRYLVLACDFDGTIATDGTVREETLAALHRLRDSGRKIVLVTGREMEDLLKVFANLDVFDRVVAENGGVLYRPASREYRPLGDPPPARFRRWPSGVASWRPGSRTRASCSRSFVISGSSCR